MTPAVPQANGNRTARGESSGFAEAACRLGLCQPPPAQRDARIGIRKRTLSLSKNVGLLGGREGVFGCLICAKMAAVEGFGSLSAAWERHAARWERWTRVVGHDVYFEHLNWPAFHALLPPTGCRTLDVGCGEGRVGRALAAEGHCVAGIDSSPTLVGLARVAGRYDELVCGDAAKLPWEADSFDLAVAFMSLHDMDDVTGAVSEVARVLRPGGWFCLAIVHPLNRAPEALDRYFDEQRFVEELELDELRMTFEGIDRPLEAYTRALSCAGFVVEELREPKPTTAALAAVPRLAKAAMRPYFLHMRCMLAR